jgi:hypothetical protein
MQRRTLAKSLVLLLVAAGLARADKFAVSVSVDFPDRDSAKIRVTYDEVVKLTGDKLPYKVEFWVHGAFAKANLKYTVEKVDGQESVTSIAGLSNDSNSRWVYFVNGIRSPYHINTQLGHDVRTIRFAREQTHDR